MGKDNLETIKKIVNQILKLLGVEKNRLTLKEREGFVYLDITTEEDSSLLIGRHGENITSLQLIITLIAYKKLGTWQRIVLNINDWRQQREEQLKKMALNWSQKAKFSGEAVQLPFLTPAERRVIHLYLSDHPNVTSYSEGEGARRRLIIKPKT